MEEEFYATMKLTSGEEIIAKVSYDVNDDVLIIHQPRIIEKVEIKRKGFLVEGIVFDDWMNGTTEDLFIIPRSQVITLIEVENSIIEYYENHLNDKSLYKKSKIQSPKSNSKRQRPESQEGFLGSIKDSKNFLEELYNKL